ncbi:hypothetical protein EZH22_26905 [Xanthobacter dioxanivorans]|uniref:Uncharacterized protein n=1 Tax=Xanthobacter dioxanivorans TaxID=2528964 RepID=A0A974SJK9_9HYPH|nr:hypothetical protein [Xanthobacter dioxanivorans]QRG06518.1 hypothetical protein EZH22_26905 [Xanthobacter dioxanivorans]
MTVRGETGRRSYGAIALRVLAFLVVAMLAATVIVAQQRGSGAYLAEFSVADPAEARHFVTALMLRDYAAAGLPAPSAFQAEYALHFPVVAPLGALSLHHFVAAGWLALLGASTPAALLLPALLAALLVVSAGWATTRSIGPLPGIAVGFVLSALVLLREAFIVVGLDLPLALLALLAALAFARWLRRGGGGDAGLFALAAVAAALIAPKGAALVLLPPLGVLLAGRLGRLGRAGFWLPLLVLAAIAAGMALPGVAMAPSSPDRLAARAMTVQAVFGTLPLALAGIGALFSIWAGWRREDGAEIMAAAAALVLALLVGLGLDADGGRPGAMLPLLAPLTMLSAFGALRLLGLLVSGWTIVSGLVVAFILLLAAMPALLEPARKASIGMDDAAQAFLAREAGGPVLVVAAGPNGEAALMAAVAQRDPARRSFVVPAARLPAGDAGALRAALDGIGASALVVETTPAARANAANRVAEALVAASPDRFRRLGTFPRADGTGQVELYAVTGGPAAPADPAGVLRRLRAPAS